MGDLLMGLSNVIIMFAKCVWPIAPTLDVTVNNNSVVTSGTVCLVR